LPTDDRPSRAQTAAALLAMPAGPGE
jgi:hypothetical protein